MFGTREGRLEMGGLLLLLTSVQLPASTMRLFAELAAKTWYQYATESKAAAMLEREAEAFSETFAASCPSTSIPPLD